MKARMAVVQMKAGMPTVAEARRRLAVELENARRRGLRVLKLVHGYGSSGVGGKLRGALRRTLAEQQSAGRVARIVPGEQWTVFDEGARALLDSYPDLRTDSDLERGNAGITFVELR